MRIAIDAAALGSDQGGDETLLTGVLLGLADVARPGDAFDLVCRASAELPAAIVAHPQFERHDLERAGGSRYFARDLPAALYRVPRPDLVFTMIHAPLRAPAPVVLLVTDLSFEHHPEYFPVATRYRLRTVVRRQVRRVRQVATISRFSRADLLTAYGLADDAVSIIPAAIVDPPAFGPAEEVEGRRWLAHVGVPGRFVLALGNLHPRKNIGRLIEAMARVRTAGSCSDVTLVVAGGRWWGSGEEQRARQLAPGTVVFLGRVADPLRETLLHLADLLVYPSLFEGFGLPPLEAMARGTPVVASNTTAVAETVGDAALTIDPTDVDAMAAAIIAVLGDPALADDLVRSGRRRAMTYSARATGRAALDAFERAITPDGALTPGRT